ncbi:hypothetical protein F5051DRAFT_474506 [Lentinula edodes]|nr:hypothetical protein F5051DRAFT_474506 [Lentinula edodes]
MVRPYDGQVKVVDDDMEEVDEAEVVTVFDVEGGVDKGLINDVEHGVEEDISEGDEGLMDVVEGTVEQVELRIFNVELVKVVDKEVEEAGGRRRRGRRAGRGRHADDWDVEELDDRATLRSASTTCEILSSRSFSKDRMPKANNIIRQQDEKSVHEDYADPRHWYNFVNANQYYFAAPQRLTAQGQIFAFFKGVNTAAVIGAVTSDVTSGVWCIPSVLLRRTTSLYSCLLLNIVRSLDDCVRHHQHIFLRSFFILQFTASRDSATALKLQGIFLRSTSDFYNSSTSTATTDSKLNFTTGGALQIPLVASTITLSGLASKVVFPGTMSFACMSYQPRSTNLTLPGTPALNTSVITVTLLWDAVLVLFTDSATATTFFSPVVSAVSGDFPNYWGLTRTIRTRLALRGDLNITASASDIPSTIASNISAPVLSGSKAAYQSCRAESSKWAVANQATTDIIVPISGVRCQRLAQRYFPQHILRESSSSFTNDTTSIGETDQNFIFPESAVLVGQGNVITQATPTPSKSSRGITGFVLNFGNFTERNGQGKVGRYTGYLDKVLGVRNEGDPFTAYFWARGCWLDRHMWLVQI